MQTNIYRGHIQSTDFFNQNNRDTLANIKIQTSGQNIQLTNVVVPNELISSIQASGEVILHIAQVKTMFYSRTTQCLYAVEKPDGMSQTSNQLNSLLLILALKDFIFIFFSLILATLVPLFFPLPFYFIFRTIYMIVSLVKTKKNIKTIHLANDINKPV